MNRDYPLRHISIRVHWNDLGWNGFVCKEPKVNGACLRLPLIAETRNDEKEISLAGKPIENGGIPSQKIKMVIDKILRVYKDKENN